ncbi:phage tail protein, partial [Escherichia coli O8:H49]
YQGTAAGDKEIKIGSGDIVSGSRLGPVTITCPINDAGTYVSTPSVYAGGARAFNFPGRYQALSGFRNSYGDEGHICLFVRIE